MNTIINNNSKPNSGNPNSGPKHVAIICDGNRRWARSRGLSAFLGHSHAVNTTIDDLVQTALDLGLEHLTFWIFSTENWNRDAKEVAWLMDLFRKLFDEKIDAYHDRGVRVLHYGNRHALAPDIQERIDRALAKTKDNTAMTVGVAMNYGGRDEITRAVGKIAKAVQAGDLQPEDITQSVIAQHLDTAGVPDPDLIIRTSGEQRLSGFMPWQQQYSEFYFPQTPFPDFTGEHLRQALADFAKRNRRFGGN